MGNNRLKSLFIKPEEEKLAATPAINVEEKHDEPEEEVIVVHKKRTTPDEAVDKQVDKLYDFIISQNIPGPDYLELKNNIKPLEKHILDEDQRIIAAYDLLKQNYPNLSKEIITSAIEKYIQMVTVEVSTKIKDIKTRAAEDSSEILEKINQSAKDKEAIQKQIDELTAQLDKINKSVEINTSKKKTIDNDRDTAINSLETAKGIVIGDLQSDLAKIKSLKLE